MRCDLKVLVAVACALAAFAHGDDGTDPTDRGVSDDRPNFLFILTDDQAPQTLGCYGNPICQTPNIDRIASRGILLRDAHHMGSWSGAVCLPSRTMIMMGQSVWRLPNFKPPGTKRNKERQRAAMAEAAKNSLPAVFNAAGYETYRTCKSGNSFNAANKLFQHVHESTRRGGNDEDGSRWHGDRVVEFLEQRAEADAPAPFLIYYGLSHPHDPRNGTDGLLKKYGAVNLKKPPTEINPAAPPLPITYLPQHPFHHGHKKLRDEERVEGVLKDRSEATVRNEIGRDYACIENIDAQVGRVLDLLEAQGELTNTYVFFTSDHGIAVGRHGLMGKQNLYEHTWEVPFLASGPGIKPGSSASGFIYLMDVLPTLCELAGIEAPESADGESFVSVLKGDKDRVRDVVYGTYSGGSKPGMRSVKTADRWKLIKYDVLDGSVRENQLFDLNTNPDELLAEHADAEVAKMTGNSPSANQINLAESDEESITAHRQELEKLLKEQMEKYGDPYKLWDQ